MVFPGLSTLGSLDLPLLDVVEPQAVKSATETSITKTTEAVFLILLSLTPKPKHGYAIMKEVRALSDNRVTLSTGTLYGALKRLLKQDWIARVNGTQPVETGRQRKEYVLTQLGKRILDAEIARMQSLAAVARLRRSEVET